MPKRSETKKKKRRLATSYPQQIGMRLKLWAFLALNVFGNGLEELDKRSNDTYKYEVIRLLNDGTELFYNVSVLTNTTNFQVRYDVQQPEFWLMNNASFYNCSYIYSWLDSHLQYNTTASGSTSVLYPSLITLLPEYEATVCALGGLYVTPTALEDSMPTPTVDGVRDAQNYDIPYMDPIQASGPFITDNVTFGNDTFDLKDFTFVLVNDTNVSYGALGLAGNPRGSGFLNTLRDNGYIASSGYSTWFSSIQFNTSGYGELRPGYIDNSYFTGPLVSYPMLDYIYSSDTEGRNEEFNNIVIPTLLLSNFLVENPETSESQALFSSANQTSGFTSDGQLPVMLDSRSMDSHLPLEVIINLALQLNAFYSDDLDRWLVPCSSILNSKSTLNFVMGPLTIKIPIWQFISTVYYETGSLKFSNGQAACSLNFRPTSATGYKSLALPFITNVFMAVDNDGKNIALAKPNNDAEKSHSSSAQTSVISSGSIPFASTFLIDSPPTLLLTSMKSDASMAIDLPLRLSGVISGGVVVTDQFGSTSIPSSSETASAAREHSSSGGAAHIQGSRMSVGTVFNAVVVLLCSILVL